MSIEVLLIPFGIAAVAAIREARSSSLCEKCRATNISDQRLLVSTLQELGVSRMVQSDGRITADSSFGRLTFQRIGEVFLGRVDGAEDAQTQAMIEAVASIAGGIAQRLMLDSVEQRAAEMGLRLISRVDDRGTVKLLYEILS